MILFAMGIIYPTFRIKNSRFSDFPISGIFNHCRTARLPQQSSSVIPNRQNFSLCTLREFIPALLFKLSPTHNTIHRRIMETVEYLGRGRMTRKTMLRINRNRLYLPCFLTSIERRASRFFSHSSPYTVFTFCLYLVFFQRNGKSFCAESRLLTDPTFLIAKRRKM